MMEQYPHQTKITYLNVTEVLRLSSFSELIFQVGYTPKKTKMTVENLHFSFGRVVSGRVDSKSLSSNRTSCMWPWMATCAACWASCLRLHLAMDFWKTTHCERGVFGNPPIYTQIYRYIRIYIYIYVYIYISAMIFLTYIYII